MKYRTLPHGGERISEIGLGTSVLGTKSEAEITATLDYSLENGVNIIDMAAGHAPVFPAFGKALGERRDDVYLQIAFGADYGTGEYGWDISLEGVKRSIEWQLRTLDTDYIDFGFIHCIDEVKDFDRYVSDGVLGYLQKLQKDGVIRHLALSTHNPVIANRVLDEGIIDLMMFSVNPMYDYGQGEFARGGSTERTDLYRRCESEGVGITVMKAFGGGQLLDPKRSPFGRALIIPQCVQYALDRPAVLSVIAGVGSVKEMDEVLVYENSSDEERDYSVISALTPKEVEGRCVYCRHCHPCPAGLDVGLINKYYDLSLAGDGMVAEHYRNLALKASDCTGCGHCDSRCPFKVRQSERMTEIREHFGC